MKVKSDFQTIAELINMIRVENKDKVFSVDELKTALGGIIPVNNLARTQLVRADVIIRVGRGKYTFPKDPVPWFCIKKFYDMSRTKNKEYRSRETQERKFIVPNSSDALEQEKPTLEQPTSAPISVSAPEPIPAPAPVPAPTCESELTPEKAIAFLKDRGYIVLKIMWFINVFSSSGWVKFPPFNGGMAK